MQTAVQNALREKGYSVVAADSPSAASAMPVEVEIHKFWAYIQQGFWTISIDFDVDIALKGPVILNGSVESVTGHQTNNTGYLATGIVENAYSDGLANLVENIKTKIKSP